MNAQERLGFKPEELAKIHDGLNDLLSNMQVFYMNVRGLHWNIKGSAFFELHEKFELIYDELALNIDAVAERILTLGATPLHSFTAYLERAEIPEAKHISDGVEAVHTLLDGFQVLLLKERAILNLADAAGDEGTVELMSGYIKQQEKHIWMYAAYLAN
ncbi:MAG: Dps family protein [Bernardetiaceae bacterium]